MRNKAVLALSVLCMGVALFATFSNDPVAGRAHGETTQPTTVSTTPTPEPSGSVETPSPAPTTTTSLLAPSVGSKAVSQPPASTTIIPTQPPGYGDDSPLCDIKGNRVCGVPDEAGTIFLVCHDTNGLPVRIVSDARNCK